VLRAVPRLEGGARALFRGLGPALVAAVPARGVHFWAYGGAKELYARRLNGGREGPGVHLLAAATAVVATAAAANPAWVVKTRLQLDRAAGGAGAARPRYSGALDCLRQTARQEGVRGLYRGFSASVLGIGETAMQWVLYEEVKRRVAARSRRMEEWGVPRSRLEEAVAPFGDAIAGGGAKFVAALSTYPHEVRYAGEILVPC
jgi:solute carrier family 25 protein 33/36